MINSRGLRHDSITLCFDYNSFGNGINRNIWTECIIHKTFDEKAWEKMGELYS